MIINLSKSSEEIPTLSWSYKYVHIEFVNLPSDSSNTGSPSYPGAEVGKVGMAFTDHSPKGPPWPIGS